ncbi:hypothetical protein VDR12_21945, partial [Xanthomonas campestris pv. campestris]|uniref:hypothetical protein n=1 Tax=Xanthomonas campestris TaxID=339 RepID=UPI002B383C1D|nr:hypothetical protein [Xanthomonas campestris pv. campestris]MEB1502872.1 hypothetical protein [Xanthomonas campestris pv. campestris]MEB1527444.1 hypothetical protein [Xanthomonas campestris pv. campestris]MEB1587880.1 hypothetical protein [Xanthomonas campestris pv. campestris]MEB1600058.1 hypothetical protein [Xanthomonas campestris pv. campestris]
DSSSCPSSWLTDFTASRGTAQRGQVMIKKLIISQFSILFSHSDDKEEKCLSSARVISSSNSYSAASSSFRGAMITP